MTPETVIVFHWCGSLSVMFIGTLIYFDTLLRSKSIKVIHPFLLSFFPLLMSEVGMLLVFFPRHITDFIRYREIQDDSWCTISAIAALALSTNIIVSAPYIAYTLYLMVTDRFDSKYTFRSYRFQTKIFIGASWTFGAIIASLFYFFGSVGPYRNLYCCSNGGGNTMELFFMVAVVVVSFSIAAYYFGISYLEVRQYANQVANSETVSAGQGLSKKHVEAVANLGIRVLLSIGVGWFPVGISYALEFSNASTSDWLPATAAIFIKTQILLDSLTFRHYVLNILKREAHRASTNRKSIAVTVTYRTKPYDDSIVFNSSMNHSITRPVKDSKN